VRDGQRSGSDPLAAAFRALANELPVLEEHVNESSRAARDEQGVVEGYKWVFSILRVALDTQVWADRARPRFVEIVGPYQKWGGDNADAYYRFVPIDPRRTYRVQGRRGDAAYLSLTVYGGPDDGRYSDRIVGSLNDRTLDIAPDGTFSMVLSAQPHRGPWLKLEPDAVCAITRDYLVDPIAGRRAEWRIESSDPSTPHREDADELARRLRAALTFVRDQANIVPLPLGELNVVDEPYPVPTATVGWAAGDAAYAMGSFALHDDEALIIRGRSPQCAFWNMCLWNQLLHTYNYDYERVTINGGQVVYEDDGSWTLVVAARDAAHPNWVSTAGHPRGRIWFRWFLPATTPQRPTTEVVPLHALPHPPRRT
jgi:hypothetical protein